MHTLLRKEWEHLYRTVWREPFAHLSKSERAKLVSACRGKAVFESLGEAQKMRRILQPEGRLRLGVYCCPLCHYFHIASRRTIASYVHLLRMSQKDPPDRQVVEQDFQPH